MLEEVSFKMVIIVRGDIKMSPGKLAAQVAHAAVECAIEAYKSQRPVFNKWRSQGSKKVVLKAKSLEELYELKDKAEKLGIITALISDAGHTELEPGTITCLGIGPGPEQLLNRITGHLPLY